MIDLDKKPANLKASNTLSAALRKNTGLHKGPPRKRLPGEATSMVIGNCTTSRNYRTGDGDPFHQVVRAGADMAYSLPSKGLGA